VCYHLGGTAEIQGSIYEQWANEYGLVFGVPTTLGGNKIVLLCDPKAIAHFYAKETWTYEYWLLLLLRCLQAMGSASTIALGSISFLDRYFQPDFWKVLESQGTFQPAQELHWTILCGTSGRLNLGK